MQRRLHPLPLLALMSCNPAALAADGPPDRTEVTTYLIGSNMQLVDMNNDCAVSDVDAAFMFDDRLTQKYGADLSGIGDLDGDGVVTGEDVVLAIGAMIKGSFGKTSPSAGPVGTDDVLATVEAVSAQEIDGDINWDGSRNLTDISLTMDMAGTEVSAFDVDQAARSLFDYIGAVRVEGRATFMASACAPATHIEGVSNTWPAVHPDWWRPNHIVSISKSYEPVWPPPNHDEYHSEHDTPPPPHSTSLSSSWPANHLLESSTTWPAPPSHSVVASLTLPTPANPTDQWPAGHSQTASSTWPTDHEQLVSRTWWPHHTESDSRQHIVPPLHIDSISRNWAHQASVSQAQWPPNHYSSVSDTWGPSHQTGTSACWPPGHLSYPSNSWPGPQPSWPPSHSSTASQAWGEPGPGSWPIFPGDHSWFTTFQDVIPFVPRIPWPP